MFSKVLVVYNRSKQNKYIASYDSCILHINIKSKYFWSTSLMKMMSCPYIFIDEYSLLQELNKGLPWILLLVLVCVDAVLWKIVHMKVNKLYHFLSALVTSALCAKNHSALLSRVASYHLSTGISLRSSFNSVETKNSSPHDLQNNFLFCHLSLLFSQYQHQFFKFLLYLEL